MKLRSVTFGVSIRIGNNQHQGVYMDLADYRDWEIEDEVDPRGVRITTRDGIVVIVPYNNCACLVQYNQPPKNANMPMAEARKPGSAKQPKRVEETVSG